MSEDALLTLSDVDVAYGQSQILFGLNLSVLKGQTMALLGRNGAGKSTTLKAVAGIVQPVRGAIRFRDNLISNRSSDNIARMGVGYVPEDRQVFPFHTVHENLDIGHKPGSGGETEWTSDKIYEVFPLLEPLRDRQAGLLSGGEQQMLTIARSLLGNPDILLLDEPSEGLAPIIVQNIAQLIVRLREAGVTILLAEQNMRFCLGVSQDAAVIDKGSIVFSGTIAALRERSDITQKYLAL